jgi:hypothetical protein
MSMNPKTLSLAQPVQPKGVSDFSGLKEVERP